MKRVYILPTLMVLLFTTCEDRKRSNPFDPEVDLDAWAPSDLQVFIISDSDIKLTWTQEYDQISGFRIERKANFGSFSQIAEVDKDVTEYTDTGLTLGTDYTYRVKAFSDENESGYATSNTTTMNIPFPSDLVVEPIGDGQIELNWSDNCTFELGFRIERSDSTANFIEIGEVSEDVTEYIDTGVNYNIAYAYRVQAFTYENESFYSNSVIIDFSYEGPTWHVSTTGSISNNGSEEFPFASVSQGINASSDGDTILVWPGVYNVNEALHIYSRTLTSRYIYDNDPSTVNSTVLNGNTNDFLLQVRSGNDYFASGADVIGFTINNSNGSGIRTEDDVSIKNCILDDFDQTWSFAISVQGLNNIISNCNLSNAYLGISVSKYNAQPVINNCIIYNNIVGMRNWTYWNGDYTSQYFHYSLFYGNNSDVYEDGTAGSWMVYFQNCLFVNPDFNDPTNNDFTLQSTSPCINAGNPDLDGDGGDYTTDADDQDPDGTRIDIGAMYYNQ